MKAALRTLWESQPSDPDPEADLGYQLAPLTIIEGTEYESQSIVLPAEEEQLHDDEFMVVDDGAVLELANCR